MQPTALAGVARGDESRHADERGAQLLFPLPDDRASVTVMNTGDLLDGRFRLRDRLGVGGMSVVWRAHDEVLGRDVAVKVLSPDLARDPALLARIRDEARAVARLRHPNIVDVYDFGEAPGPLPYVVMEVVAGRPLSELLAGGTVSWRLAVLISAQVAAALAAAHDRGVVHRDVKPGNVVVSGARVKLVDFGISAVSGDDDRAAGELLGTPAYLAPERLEHGVVRPATDVYALGLLLYRALAGRMPWQASTATQMLRAHRYHEPNALPRIAGLPGDVAALCRQCLDKDPARRPSAAAVATVLGAAVGVSPAVLELPGAAGSTGQRGVPAPATAPVRRPVAALAASTHAITGRLTAGLRRHRRLAVATGATALLLAGGVLTAKLPRDPGSPQAGGPAGQPAQAEAPVTPATTAPTPRCTIGYMVTASGGRFTTKVSIANTGAVPIPAAPLTFTLPGEQQLRSAAPGTWRQSGRTVTARIADLAPGSRQAATIRGTYQGVHALPDRFQLNGTTCQVTLSVAAAAPTRAASGTGPAGEAAGNPAKGGQTTARTEKKTAKIEKKTEKKSKSKPAASDSDEDEADEDEADEDEGEDGEE